MVGIKMFTPVVLRKKEVNSYCYIKNNGEVKVKIVNRKQTIFQWIYELFELLD